MGRDFPLAVGLVLAQSDRASRNRGSISTLHKQGGEVGGDIGIVPDGDHVHQFELVVPDACSPASKKISDCGWTGD